jgi:hypothetical protein
MCISILVQRSLLLSINGTSTSVKTEYVLIAVLVQRYIECDYILE